MAVISIAWNRVRHRILTTTLTDQYVLDAPQWVARCDCGWTSDPQARMSLAGDLGHRHITGIGVFD